MGWLEDDSFKFWLAPNFQGQTASVSFFLEGIPMDLFVANPPSWTLRGTLEGIDRQHHWKQCEAGTETSTKWWSNSLATEISPKWWWRFSKGHGDPEIFRESLGWWNMIPFGQISKFGGLGVHRISILRCFGEKSPVTTQKTRDFDSPNIREFAGKTNVSNYPFFQNSGWWNITLDSYVDGTAAKKFVLMPKMCMYICSCLWLLMYIHRFMHIKLHTDCAGSFSSKDIYYIIYQVIQSDLFIR